MPQNDQARLKATGLDFVVIGESVSSFMARRWALFGLDVCCRFGEENVQRIEAAVRDLRPFHRLTANKLTLEMTRTAFCRVEKFVPANGFGKIGLSQ